MSIEYDGAGKIIIAANTGSSGQRLRRTLTGAFFQKCAIDVKAIGKKI
jgi:hypothetical protein